MEEGTYRRPNGGVEQLFPALLFFVFLICTIFTILIGSRVYENIRRRDDATFHADTALAYLTNKVRQGDAAGSVSVREMEGCSVLVLTSHLEGEDYETWLYAYGGDGESADADGSKRLMELFTMADSALELSAGQEIMDCEGLEFQLTETDGAERILSIALESGGETHRARLLLRSDERGGWS